MADEKPRFKGKGKQVLFQKLYEIFKDVYYDLNTANKKEAIDLTAEKANTSKKNVNDMLKADSDLGGGGKSLSTWDELRLKKNAALNNPSIMQRQIEEPASQTRAVRAAETKAYGKSLLFGLPVAGAGMGGTYLLGRSDEKNKSIIPMPMPIPVEDLVTKEEIVADSQMTRQERFDKEFAKAFQNNLEEFVFIEDDGTEQLTKVELATPDPDYVFRRTKKNKGSILESEERRGQGYEVLRPSPSMIDRLAEALMTEKAKEQERIREQTRRNTRPMPGTNEADPSTVQINVNVKGRDPETAYQEESEINREIYGVGPPKREGEAEGGMPDLTGDGKVTQADVLKGRGVFQEGGMPMPEEQDMPVDTYPNIPPEEMAAVEASQLPDEEMETNYLDFVIDESLNDEEQMYLMNALESDPRLSQIFDKVLDTASEFSGAGEVDGPGTGVSDSIPARLSDGEFVITKKATDAIGADNLQRMMDDAERAYDGGYQLKPMAFGGVVEDEELEDSNKDYLSKTDEEIKKIMIGANRMPSVR